MLLGFKTLKKKESCRIPGVSEEEVYYQINDVVWNILNNKQAFNLEWSETSTGGSYLCQVLSLTIQA